MCFRLFFAIVDCLLPHPGFSKHHQFNPAISGGCVSYTSHPSTPYRPWVLVQSTDSKSWIYTWNKVHQVWNMFSPFWHLGNFGNISNKKTAVHHKSSWFILTWISSRSWNKEHGKRSNHRCRDIMPMADQQKLTAILLQLFQQLWSFWRLKLFVPAQIFPLKFLSALKSWKNSMSISKEDASG